MPPSAEYALEMASSSGFAPTFHQIYAYYAARLREERMAKTKSVSVCCPFHNDKNPSMGINLEIGGWKCYTCNEGGGIFAFEKKLYPNADNETLWKQIYELCGMPVPQRRSPDSGRILTATYDYTDVTGKVVYQKLRYEYPAEMNKPKSFSQRQPGPTGKGWVYNLDGVKKVLYKLPEVVTCQFAYIVEGEKDADNLAAAFDPYMNAHPDQRIATTCNFDGAAAKGPSKWLQEYNPFFTGKMVVILADNDEAGEHHAEQVALGVSQYAQAVKVVRLPGVAEHGDVSDWLKAGGTIEQLLKLVKETPQWTSPADSLEAIAIDDGWPEPMSEEAFHGPAGKFVKLVSPESEADPHALLLSFLVIFGCMVGRGPFYQVEATRHGTNLFAVLVGDSAKARKGTAVDRVSTLLSSVDPQFVENRLHSGLSSGEGLIEAVRDPREVSSQEGTKPGRTNAEHQAVDQGVTDKRLLAIETEFASVLHQSGRSGNILSAILRAAWDGKPLRVLAKSNKDSCKEPHIAILGNITIEEVRELLTTNDKANGFGNRFLWCCTRRSKELPHGGMPLDADKANALIEELKLALDFSKTTQQVEWQPQACAAWESAYHVLTESATGIYGMMTARAEPQVARLAMLFALLDCSNLIRLEHLKAAQEVWAYCDDSARYIFGQVQRDDTAGRILKMLRSAPDGKSRSELHQGFNGHKKAEELNRALALLQKQNKVTSETIKTAGYSVTKWKILE